MFVVGWYEGALLKLARDMNLRETKRNKIREIPKNILPYFLVFSLYLSLVSDNEDSALAGRKFTSPHSTSYPRDMVKTYLLT